MGKTAYRHPTVSLRSAVGRFTSNPEHLLDKLASVAAPEADVGAGIVRCLCNISLLNSLGLDTSERELVLKAVSFALQEKMDHVPRGAQSGSSGLDLLLLCLCITPFQAISKTGEFGARVKMWEEIHEQFHRCQAVLQKMQKQQADENCKQQLEERTPLLPSVVRTALAAGNYHAKSF